MVLVSCSTGKTEMQSRGNFNPKLTAHIRCAKTRAGVFTGYQTIHNVCNRFHHVVPMTKTTPVKSQQAQTFSTSHAVLGELLLHFHFIRGPSQVGQ